MRGLSQPPAERERLAVLSSVSAGAGTAGDGSDCRPTCAVCLSRLRSWRDLRCRGGEARGPGRPETAATAVLRWRLRVVGRSVSAACGAGKTRGAVERKRGGRDGRRRQRLPFYMRGLSQPPAELERLAVPWRLNAGAGTANDGSDCRSTLETACCGAVCLSRLRSWRDLRCCGG
jgi:hypothetical protein